MAKQRKQETETPVQQEVQKEKVKTASDKTEKVDKTEKREKKREKKPSPPKEPEAPVVVDEPVVEAETTEKKKRVQPTKETVMASFDELLESIESAITDIRENEGKPKGIKFLRTLSKKVKSIKNQSGRLIKKRKSTTTEKKQNTNSGFLKPVKISAEMAKFAGWNVNEQKSRVDVTKFLCKYIEDHKLQNPKDRREILADNKLSKLLNYDAKTSQPLTYYRIQNYIKPHFLKDQITA